jgi:hypothetical protein
MKELILTNHAKPALVDDEDYDRVIAVSDSWNYAGTSIRCVSRIHRGRVYFSLARLIMNLKKGDPNDIDHRDRDIFNNQKSNLRVVTRSQNLTNKAKRTGTTSKYRNVYFCKSRQKWVARVTVNGRTISGGRFNSEIEAAMKADELMTKYQKEFANLNLTSNEPSATTVRSIPLVAEEFSEQ